MSRSNKGIRDIVKDNRTGTSEIRPPSQTGLPQVAPSKMTGKHANSNIIIDI